MEETNMLIPHLHFCGNCKEAIDLYERAFKTKVETIDYMSDGKKIAHAAMDIHKQRVFLNDNFGNKNKSLDCAVHLIITFNTVDELLACYEILKTDDKNIHPFNETPYSKLVGNFMDKFGVLWGFMVTA
jgi:PhnB protein